MKSKYFTDIILEARLTVRLLRDRRVPFYLKLLPGLCVLYLIVPTDLLPGPFDDVVVLYLGMVFFIDLCPQEVVAEHVRDLRGRDPSNPAPADTPQQPPKEEDVIDAEFRDK
jgi:uncharacterized membrane protein YkvA (DUF1232 family)